MDHQGLLQLHRQVRLGAEAAQLQICLATVVFEEVQAALTDAHALGMLGQAPYRELRSLVPVPRVVRVQSDRKPEPGQASWQELEPVWWLFFKQKHHTPGQK